MGRAVQRGEKVVLPRTDTNAVGAHRTRQVASLQGVKTNRNNQTLTIYYTIVYKLFFIYFRFRSYIIRKQPARDRAKRLYKISIKVNYSNNFCNFANDKTMKQVKIEPVKSSDTASLYTIIFEGDNMSEFTKFMMRFKDNAHLQRDYQLIVYALQKILENGALERYFRPEGKFADRVCALPIDSGKLRLYCLRLSDKILILGNGGIKETKTYNENQELNGYVIDLQKFDALLRASEKEGSIVIEETVITGIDNKSFVL